MDKKIMMKNSLIFLLAFISSSLASENRSGVSWIACVVHLNMQTEVTEMDQISIKVEAQRERYKMLSKPEINFLYKWVSVDRFGNAMIYIPYNFSYNVSGGKLLKHSDFSLLIRKGTEVETININQLEISSDLRFINIKS